MAYPISDVPRRIVYSGSAGVGPYAFTFEVLTASDIAVYKNQTLLTLTTDYTVSINTGTGTGTVTLVVAATGSDTVTLVGDRAIQRTSDFVTGGDLFANTLNAELDAQTIYAQQIDEKAERAIRAPVTDPTTINMVLPAAADRAGKILRFGSNGDPAVSSISTISGPTTDSSLVEYLPAGLGAVATTVQARLRAFDEVTKPESLGGDFVQRVIDPGSGGAFTWMWGHKNNNITLVSGGNFVFGGTSSNPHAIADGSFLCVIGGGYDNEIGANAEASTMAGGAHHRVAASASHASILGGSYQTVNGSYGVAVGGTQNTAQSTYSFVGGGQSNIAGDSNLPSIDTRSAFVGAGANNTAKGIRSAIVAGGTNMASGEEAFVGAGNNNTASGQDAFVGAGSSNTASGSKSVVVGGEVNTASGTASLVGGSTNTASGSYAVALGEFNEASGAGGNAIGIRGKAYLRAQRAHASGYFAARGDAQASDLVARQSTTGASGVDLDLNGGASNKIVLPDNTTWGFIVYVIGRRADADGENAFYEFKGAIKRDANAASTAIVGAVTKTVIAEDTAGWDANITADTTNGAMKITCEGTVGTIRWVARVQLIEVSG